MLIEPYNFTKYNGSIERSLKIRLNFLSSEYKRKEKQAESNFNKDCSRFRTEDLVI